MKIFNFIATPKTSQKYVACERVHNLEAANKYRNNRACSRQAIGTGYSSNHRCNTQMCGHTFKRYCCNMVTMDQLNPPIAWQKITESQCTKVVQFWRGGFSIYSSSVDKTIQSLVRVEIVSLIQPRPLVIRSISFTTVYAYNLKPKQRMAQHKSK